MKRAAAAISTLKQPGSDSALSHYAHRLVSPKPRPGFLPILGAFCFALVAVSDAAAQKRVTTPSTYGDAMRWYGKAARAGSPRAQFLLGLKYEAGVGPDADRGKAVQWFRRAAEGGHALAQYRLASALHEGIGVERNIGEAAEWYERAAENGIPEAAFNAAFIREKGLAGTADAAGAAKWYLMAAEAGLARARFNLGVLHAEGRGVARDPVEAWAWFACAAAAGLPNAESYRQRLDVKLNEAQRASARALAESRCGSRDRR